MSRCETNGDVSTDESAKCGLNTLLVYVAEAAGATFLTTHTHLWNDGGRRRAVRHGFGLTCKGSEFLFQIIDLRIEVGEPIEQKTAKLSDRRCSRIAPDHPSAHTPREGEGATRLSPCLPDAPPLHGPCSTDFQANSASIQASISQQFFGAGQLFPSVTADVEDIAAGVLGRKPTKAELKTLNAVGRGPGGLHATRRLLGRA